MDKGQAKREKDDDIEKTKKVREREKRIRENNKTRNEEEFDIETETVIQMTNKNKMRKEEQKRKELTKEARKRKKKIKRIKFLLKLIIFVGLISGAMIFSLTSPIFNIKKINVSNNSEISSDTVISLSGITQDENIFRFYKGSGTNKIKENPYIENVKIHRKLPNTVEIEVEERVAKYCVDYMQKYAYINIQGYILEISEDSKKLPIIYGITTNEEEVVPGNRLNNEDLSRLEDVIKIMNATTEKELDGKVTGIDISDKNKYILYLGEEKKNVHLGDATNLSNKMLYVVAIMEQEKEKEGDIYVNGDLNNKFQPYFREKV